MKKLTIILLLLMYNATIIAQNTPYFLQSINWQNYRNGNGFKLMQKENGTFLIAGSNADTIVWSIFLCEMDNVGQISNIHNYVDTNYYAGARTIVPINQGYLILGAAYKPTSRAYGYSIKVTDTYEQVAAGFITDTTHYNPIYKVCKSIDGSGYFAVGEKSTYDPPSVPYLVKLDTAGNFMWSRDYPEFSAGSSLAISSPFRDIEPAKDGSGYYAAGSSNIWAGGGNVLLAKIADNGDIIWSETYDLTERDLGSSVVETADGGCLLVGRGKLSNENRGLIIKIKPDRSVDWYKTQYFYGGGAYHVQELADGSFIIAGDYLNTTIVNVTDTYDFDTEILKLSANGDFVWRRRIAAGNDDDYLYDMILAKDSSIVICGRTESNLPDNVYANLYILKTNCMGLLTQPQANFTAQIDTNALTATFQNLSQFVYPDSIDGGHYIWDFGDGATSTQINPTHTYTQGGNYTVTLTAVVCSDTSVYTSPISTYAVGINQVLPLEGGVRGGLCTVLPNPAQNYLVVSSQTSTTNATFVLYDVLGKEVARQVLSANGTSVKTEHLPSGIYLYQIINPQNQTLQYGKLSILH